MAVSRPESPLTKLARLLGGVVLMRGPLGHQVLGQLLVSDLRESELAGASVVLAAGSRRKSTLARAAIGTAAPAFALERHYGKVGAQIARRQAAVAERERLVREQAREPSGPEVGLLYREIEALQRELEVLRRDKLALEQAIAAAGTTSTTGTGAPHEPGASPIAPPITTPTIDPPPAADCAARSTIVEAPRPSRPPARPAKPTKPTKPTKPARKPKGRR